MNGERERADIIYQLMMFLYRENKGGWEDDVYGGVITVLDRKVREGSFSRSWKEVRE